MPPPAGAGPHARMDRRHLSMALSRLPDHPAPDATLEQVRTPGPLAADFLLMAAEAGDIAGRRVVDLGCGTGAFAIGAALLGAEQVVGIDVDGPALAAAKAAAERLHIQEHVTFHEADVSALTPDDLIALVGGPVDTVIMNPPFGADLVSRARGGDRPFLSLAFRSARLVYGLHPVQTERFLVAFARDGGFTVEKGFEVPFPLPGRFAHHKDLLRHIPVGGYRFVRS